MIDRLFQIKLIWSDPETRQRKEMQKPMPITIGRQESNDVSIVEEHVSREHAILKLAAGEVHLVDHSRHGTVVNGKRIHRTQKTLPHKASFKIADCTFTLKHHPRQVRCHNCDHVVSLHKRDCSYCGHALTGAATVPYAAAELKIESQGSRCYVR